MASVRPHHCQHETRHWEQRHQRAHERFLKAIRELGELRCVQEYGSDHQCPDMAARME